MGFLARPYTLPEPLATFDRQVLIDGRWKVGGIGRYSAEMIKRAPSNAHILTGGPQPASFISPLWLGYQTRRAQPTTFFSPSFMPPWPPSGPAVNTVHDLIHLYAGGLSRCFYEIVI